MWRLALLLVLALSVRAQDDDADRLLTSVRQPVIVEANLPNITVGFKTGPNIPGTQFTIKCVLEGEGCDATPQGQSVSGSLPVKPAAVEGTVQGLEVDQTYSCFVETTLSENGKVSYCQEAMPFPGVVRFELIFGAYPNAAAFGPSEQAQVCANVLSLQPGGTCSVLRVTDGSAIVLIQVEYDDFRNTWSLTETLTQNATAVTAALASGLEGSVEIADVETEPPVPNPLSPTNVAANTASDCTPSVVVTWAAPQRSSTITGYFVSCTSLTAPAVNRTVAATQRNTTLSIQAEEEYTCSVVSQGPSGASAPAAAPSPVTYRYPNACKPGQVTNVATAQVSGKYLQRQVTWTPPPSPQIPISSYTVLCSTDSLPDGNRTTSIGADQVSAIVGAGDEGPLSQGSVYMCYVYASNAAGDGPTAGSPSFVTDTLISKLGNGVPRSDLPSSSTWGPDAWYSGDTRTSAGYASVLGNFSTMPAYYPDLPASAFTDANDALINESFIYFNQQDPDLYPSSEDGYVFMINGQGLEGTTKADLINWFDTTWFSSGDHLSLVDVYDESFNVTFKAALTPANTVLKYSIKAACTPAEEVLCSYSIVYRFQHDNESWREYSYDKDGKFAIFWSWCYGSVSNPPTAGQFIDPTGQQGSESDNQFSYSTWSSDSTNDILTTCLTQGYAFGSGFSIGALTNKQTLAVDWLQQSFYRNASTINFISSSS